MDVHVVALSGDGVGPEVTAQALAVLEAVTELYGHHLTVVHGDIGWAATKRSGSSFPSETQNACRDTQAVFLGAVGHPDASGCSPNASPEAALLKLRQLCGAFANLRPAKMSEHLLPCSPLRPEVVRGTDLLFVRELGGGIYYGAADRRDDSAMNTMSYTTDEVRRVARTAFALARQRGGRVVSVDKANVLVVSQLWRDVVNEVSEEFSGVSLSHMLVDRAAMELVFRPTQFDVFLTSNMFGDILSDEAAALTGSIGTLGSASIGGEVDIYEPVHGSAPDIAGKDLANPIGAIQSMAMLLHHTFGLHAEAMTVQRAVDDVLGRGLRTRDVAGGGASVGTQAFGEAVVKSVLSGKDVGAMSA